MEGRSVMMVMMSLEIVMRLLVDIRGFYRVGAPDIGAYETGASKFLLALKDDIRWRYGYHLCRVGPRAICYGINK